MTNEKMLTDFRHPSTYPQTQKPLKLKRKPPNRTTSNSLRGKLYRAQRKQYEEQLTAQVFHLRQYLSILQNSHLIEQQRALQRRHSRTGSLAQIGFAYMKRFEFGLRTSLLETPIRERGFRQWQLTDAMNDHRRRQEIFLRANTTPDIMVGDILGVDSLLDQWRRYTAACPNFHNRVRNIEVIGEESDPMVIISGTLSTCISHDTFLFMFPFAIQDEALIERCLCKQVTFSTTFWIRFNEQGLMCCVGLEVGFVEGLIAAGISLQDVEFLMQKASITSQYTLKSADPVGDDIIQDSSSCVEELVDVSDAQSEFEAEDVKKMDMKFILTSSEDGEHK